MACESKAVRMIVALKNFWLIAHRDSIGYRTVGLIRHDSVARSFVSTIGN